jgi:hypothetical protein
MHASVHRGALTGQTDGSTRISNTYSTREPRELPTDGQNVLRSSRVPAARAWIYRARRIKNKNKRRRSKRATERNRTRHVHEYPFTTYDAGGGGTHRHAVTRRPQDTVQEAVHRLQLDVVRGRLVTCSRAQRATLCSPRRIW